MLYRRLLAYVKPYRKVFFFAIIGMIVVAATQPGLPYLIKGITDQGFIAKDDSYIRMIPIYLIWIWSICALQWKIMCWPANLPPN